MQSDEQTGGYLQSIVACMYSMYIETNALTSIYFVIFQTHMGKVERHRVPISLAISAIQARFR